MEIDKFKTAWQQQSFERNPLGSTAPGSRSVQFLRASLFRDLQKSEELQRLIFCPLFALVFAGAAFIIMPAGAGRMAAILLGIALASDGFVGAILLTHRYGTPPTSSMLDFVRREREQVLTRIRVERYSRVLMLGLFAAAVVVLAVRRPVVTPREGAFEALGTMAVMTAFLAFAWRRAKSRSREFSRVLDRYLRDLSE
jgi:hypothetical protein